MILNCNLRLSQARGGFPGLGGGKTNKKRCILPNGNPESFLFMRKCFIIDRNNSS